MVEEIVKWLSEHKDMLVDNIPNFIIGFVLFVFMIWLIWYFKSKRRRRHFRFHWHHFTYAIGLRKIMSRKYVGKVHVHECFDPLVDFLPHKHIIFNKETLEEPNLIRKKCFSSFTESPTVFRKASTLRFTRLSVREPG